MIKMWILNKWQFLLLKYEFLHIYNSVFRVGMRLVILNLIN